MSHYTLQQQQNGTNRRVSLNSVTFKHGNNKEASNNEAPPSNKKA